MSKNREHVIWESKDGSWNIGFYQFVQTGEDEEWDVEYIYSEFFWARTGFKTSDLARRAWTGANPGADYTINDYSTSAGACDEYDEMVKCLNDSGYAEKRRIRQQETEVHNRAAKAAEGVRMLPGVDVEVIIGNSGVTQFLTGTLRPDGDWLVIRDRGIAYKVWHVHEQRAWTGKRHNEAWGVRSVKSASRSSRWG